MKFRGTCIILCAVLAALCLSCCDHSDDEDNRLDKTVVVYMVAENSLAVGDFHRLDLNEMVSVVGDIPKNSRVVVYLDDTAYPHIYSIEKTKDGTNLKVLKEFTSDVDSCDPQMLKDVMAFVTHKYPSKSYGLVFWSHGLGWLPAAASRAPQMRSIGVDNGRNSTTGGGSVMEIEELAEALDEVKNLEFIMFDACFMQNVEVAYELRHVTNYVIASPAEIPNPGAPYDAILPLMVKEKADVRGIIESYYNYYALNDVYIRENSGYKFGALLSVIDCRRLDNLQSVTQQMIAKYGSMDEDKALENVLRYYPNSSSVFPEFFDMKAYMHHLIGAGSEWQMWLTSFNAAVPYAEATDWWYSSYSSNGYMYVNNPADYGGVAMYVPEPGNYFIQKNKWFRDTSWYSVSGWPEVGW